MRTNVRIEKMRLPALTATPTRTELAAGLTISDSAGVFVNGNVFAGMSPKAVNLNASNTMSRSAITNNYFVETTAGIQTVAVDKAAAGSNYSVPREN